MDLALLLLAAITLDMDYSGISVTAKFVGRFHVLRKVLNVLNKNRLTG